MSLLNKGVKAKQKYLLYGLFAALLFIAFIVVYTKENAGPKFDTAPKEDSEVVYERYSALSGKLDEDEVWRAQSSNEIDELKQENQALSNQISTLRKEMEKRVRDEVNSQSAVIRNDLKTEQQRDLQTLKDQTQQLRVKAQQEAQLRAKKAAEREQANQHSQANKGVTVSRKFVQPPQSAPFMRNQPELGAYHGNDLYKQPAVTAASSLSFDVQTVNTEEELKAVQQEGMAQEQLVNSGSFIENYVPSGSFVPALILGGVDAPTGGQAQKNPSVVLLEIDAVAQLPNSHQYDFKECRAIGAAVGDISSERADTRIQTISCIDTQERIYEAHVNAVVFDETGKSGIKGRLVSKQGQMIANSLLAGIGSGIGNAFQQSSTNYSTNALGVQQQGFVSAGDAAVAGIGSGVGTALDRLARYYIDLAEQVFPVIEVDAGRRVDIVFTRGFQFKPLEAELTVTQQAGEQQQASLDKPIGDMTIGDLANGASQTMAQAQHMTPVTGLQY